MGPVSVWFTSFYEWAVMLAMWRNLSAFIYTQPAGRTGRKGFTQKEFLRVVPVRPFICEGKTCFHSGQDNVRVIFCGSFCLSLSLFFDILGNGYKSLVLPHKVSESLQLTSDTPKEVVGKLLHNLQLDDISLKDPKPETEKWIRCLTRDAKNRGRTDVVKFLRDIMPAGTAGKQAGMVSGSETRFRRKLRHKKSLKKSFILNENWIEHIQKTVLISFCM